MNFKFSCKFKFNSERYIHGFLHVFYPSSLEYNKPKWLGRLKEIGKKVEESNESMIKSLKDDIVRLSKKIESQTQDIKDTFEEKFKVLMGEKEEEI